MKMQVTACRLLLIIGLGSTLFLFRSTHEKGNLSVKPFLLGNELKEQDNDEEFTNERLRHEFEMLRNPITGTIPANFHELEVQAVKNLPSKGTFYNPLLTRITSSYSLNGTSSTLNQNTYAPIGPSNQAGRSRALGIDKRNPNIMITGGTTGGIFRSTDGGNSWTFVSPENDIRSMNSIAQDPTNPDTWYVGTGEVFYTVSTADIAGTVGWGVFKSTDNGVTWTKLTSTQDAFQHQFNGQFDLVHRIAVHPTTGAVYAAVHNRIMKSSDGGTTWLTVLGGTQANNALGGLTEVLIPSNGSKIFAAVSGENVDRGLVGVWESTTGDIGSWTRIAGGTTLGTDSVSQWQPYGKWGRVVLAINSTNTKLFAFYKNGKDASTSTPSPEADLFRADISSGTPATYVWTNLSAWVQDEPNYNEAGIDPYTTQFNGFNMSLSVKPDNDNILYEGGTVLERVDLTQTDPTKKFRRMGGYGKGFFPNGTNFIYPEHHPDIHGIYFPPGDANTVITVDDGGVQKTINGAMADTTQWKSLDSTLQTLQYQFVNIYPDTDANWIIGGAQDNGTLINLNAPQDLEQNQLGSGDGAGAAISRFTKIGSTWKQYFYLTISQGTLYRSNFIWNYNSSQNQLSYQSNTFDNITPTGLDGKGQWLTLIVNDPDSTEHLYYNSKNRLFRTTSASTVSSTTWTEITGISNTIPSTTEFSSMEISKRKNGIKYLYFGTNTGKVYRLNNANTAAATATPVDITPTSMSANSYVAGVAINPRNPDTVMVVVSNYDQPSAVVNNIFWTGNATSASPTWTVIDGALEPVSVQSCAIVVKNAGVEYYAGTSVGLYSTTSINGNSTSWVQEGSGQMKTAIIRSLKNRQPDNTLVVGTHGDGAFMAQIGDAVTITDAITGIPVITNDKNFIVSAYPTLAANKLYYTIGNLFSIKKITVQLYGINGQEMYAQERAYQNGDIDLTYFARGNYLLMINSDDGKYRFIQKIVKN